MEKKKKEKKQAAPPEKYFNAMVQVFFAFHRKHFKDEDGYGLEPKWNAATRGMESKGLKEILITLRLIAEGKGLEWTEELATSRFLIFLQRAFTKSFFRRNFMCCMLNKYRVDILSSSYNPNLVQKILEIWYFEFPNYTVDHDKDKTAGEIIVGFLKQQYLIKSLEFEEKSVLGSVRYIFQWIKRERFWCTKSLNSIARNIQDIKNQINLEKNGNAGKGSLGEKPNPRINTSGDFGQL